MPSHFSCVQPCDLWSVANHAALSLAFSRQEYCSGLPFPSPGDRPNPGIKPSSLVSLTLAGGLFTTTTIWKAHYTLYIYIYNNFTPLSLIIKKKTTMVLGFCLNILITSTFVRLLSEAVKALGKFYLFQTLDCIKDINVGLLSFNVWYVFNISFWLWWIVDLYIPLVIVVLKSAVTTACIVLPFSEEQKPLAHYNHKP